jgi:hypothetical protein
MINYIRSYKFYFTCLNFFLYLSNEFKRAGDLDVNSPRYLTIFMVFCLVWVMACVHSGETVSDEGARRVSAADQIEFDFADGASLLVVSPVEMNSLTLNNFRVGTAKNRILIVGVQVEEGGKENVADTVISSITLGNRALTLLSGSEVQLSSIWRGKEYFLKVALYYLLNPPTGENDITVSFAGPVTSANVGAISLSNAQQTAPVNLVTNKEENQKKIITHITTKSNGAWVVDIVGCGHKSKLKPKTPDHTQRFNAQEESGGKSSLLGATLPVPAAGEVALHWAQSRRAINRLVHIAVEISPYR